MSSKVTNISASTSSSKNNQNNQNNKNRNVKETNYNITAVTNQNEEMSTRIDINTLKYIDDKISGLEKQLMKNKRDLKERRHNQGFVGSQNQGPRSPHSPEEQKESRESLRCYTCNPRGKVKKHIIGTSNCNEFIFHYDMGSRPIILVTPRIHVTSIVQLSPMLIMSLHKSIEAFCSFWNIFDYQVTINYGALKNNDHFHAKIKIHDPKIVSRMKGDHFRRINLEKTYDPVNQ